MADILTKRGKGWDFLFLFSWDNSLGQDKGNLIKLNIIITNNNILIIKRESSEKWWKNETHADPCDQPDAHSAAFAYSPSPRPPRWNLIPKKKGFVMKCWKSVRFRNCYIIPSIHKYGCYFYQPHSFHKTSLNLFCWWIIFCCYDSVIFFILIMFSSIIIEYFTGLMCNLKLQLWF